MAFQPGTGPSAVAFTMRVPWRTPRERKVSEASTRNTRPGRSDSAPISSRNLEASPSSGGLAEPQAPPVEFARRVALAVVITVGIVAVAALLFKLSQILLLI